MKHFDDSIQETSSLPKVEAKVRRKHPHRSLFAFVFSFLCFAVGVICIGFGVKMMLPDFLSLHDFKELSREVKGPVKPAVTPDASDFDGPVASSDESSDDTASSPDEGAYSIDWDALYDNSRDTVAWVSVDNTDIDFPVIQGNDNWYYLYHDIWGRESYASTFLDYRANPDGMNDIVYGHTHWANTGFHQIAEVDEQWRFDEIGKVRYSTPKSGMTVYTPICGIHTYPQFDAVQSFDFEPDAVELSALYTSILNDHASAGDWNHLTLPGEVPAFDESEMIYVPTGERNVDHWWVLTDAEKREASADATLGSFHAWLSELCNYSSSRVSDIESYIVSSRRCLVLACCSWPYDSHRTLLVCVA